MSCRTPVRTFVSFCVVGCAVSQHGVATPAHPAIESIDATISQVETGGHWEGARGRGHYRAVVQHLCSPEHCHDQLFLQWIWEADPDLMRKDPAADDKVLATIYVKETGNLTNFTDVRFVEDGSSSALQVRNFVPGAPPELHWTRCIVLGADGKYVHRYSPCKKRR
jgi:hypothetical protein